MIELTVTGLRLEICPQGIAICGSDQGGRKVRLVAPVESLDDLRTGIAEIVRQAGD